MHLFSTATCLNETLLSIGNTKHVKKKSRIKETANLLTDADSSTDIFAGAVEKGADSPVG